jgi:hypothetical protein
VEKNEIIARLMQNKARTPEYSAFLDNNHNAIDAMIETVAKGLSADEVYRRFNTSYEQDAALSVLEVLAGREVLDDILFPED